MNSEQDGTHVDNPGPDEEEEWSGPDFTMPSWYGQPAAPAAPAPADRHGAGALPVGGPADPV
ncbi:MAG: hypothetical protein HOV66_23445, partial [Streptomycetaceae bacterium]|nr:hypothetical protein [Streptomycetaceae bacterium]